MSQFDDSHRAKLRIMAAILLCVAAGTSLSVAKGGTDSAAHRERLRLAQEPKEAQQVLAVQKSLVAARTQPKAPETREVVISGQIGGMPNVWPEMHPKFPWYEGQASLFLVDSKIAAQFATHAKQHAGGNCTFCQALAEKNANAIAVVNFVDEHGEIIRTDARELLGLKENQTVVVRGKARLLGGAMLVIDADGVYTRR